MSKRDPHILLEDMHTAIGKIEHYTAGLTKDEFVADDKTVDAVVRNREIIGEAVRQLPEDFREANTQIPWGEIAGLRNRIVHDYFGIDLDLIWQIVSGDLPMLRSKLDDLKS